MGIAVLDRFNRADTAVETIGVAESGHAWSGTVGTGGTGTANGFQVYGQKLLNTGTGNERFALLVAGVTDGTFQVTVAGLPIAGDGGLWIRGDASSANGILFNFETPNYGIYTRSGGGYTKQATIAKNPAIGDVCRFVCSGTSVIASVGGLSATITSSLAGTYVGVRISQGSGTTGGMAFKDFTVLAPGYNFGIAAGGGYG